MKYVSDNSMLKLNETNSDRSRGFRRLPYMLLSIKVNTSKAFLCYLIFTVNIVSQGNYSRSIGTLTTFLNISSTSGYKRVKLLCRSKFWTSVSSSSTISGFTCTSFEYIWFSLNTVSISQLFSDDADCRLLSRTRRL